MDILWQQYDSSVLVACRPTQQYLYSCTEYCLGFMLGVNDSHVTKAKIDHGSVNQNVCIDRALNFTLHNLLRCCCSMMMYDITALHT